MIEEGSESSGAERMATSVQQLVRESASFEEIRRAGIGLVAYAEPDAIVLRTDPPPGSRWPRLEARIRGSRWWSPEGMYHAEQLAGRLTAELRMKWERWVAGY